MKEMSAYLMLVLGGNENPTADDVTKALASVGIEADSGALNNLISELDGKDLGEILEDGSKLLAKFGSGGGGAAAEEKEVEKEEEVEEAPPAGDMFGGKS